MPLVFVSIQTYPNIVDLICQRRPCSEGALSERQFVRGYLLQCALGFATNRTISAPYTPHSFIEAQSLPTGFVRVSTLHRRVKVSGKSESGAPFPRSCNLIQGQGVSVTNLHIRGSARADFRPSPSEKLLNPPIGHLGSTPRHILRGNLWQPTPHDSSRRCSTLLERDGVPAHVCRGLSVVTVPSASSRMEPYERGRLPGDSHAVITAFTKWE